MSSLVTIKSFKNGLSIYLDPEADFEDIKNAVAEKFREASGFFKDAKMAISFENRILDEEEERVLLQMIDDNSQVNVLCIIGKNDYTEKQFVKALKQMEMQVASAGNMAQIYKGNLNNHKRLETSETIIIFGDVNPGCLISSDKDIIVMGGLYGQANAGLDGKGGHFVIALEMAPEKLMINNYNYRITEKSKWPIKPKVQPKIAFELDGTITMDSVSKDLIQSLVK